MNHPTAFISYSWDSKEHRVWVTELAERLRTDGVDAKLDCWHSGPEGQPPESSEGEVPLDAVFLIVCTPDYKKKSDASQVDTDSEGGIMTSEAYRSLNQRNFIPILVRGAWEESAPAWLIGRHYVDLSDSTKFERQYRGLVAKIKVLEYGRESEARVQQAEQYRRRFRDSVQDTEG